jgi:Holliday junction resolvase
MYARRKDTAHNPIAQGLKAHGFSVADTSRLGDDFPDLVIGKHGITALVEVKSQDRRKNGLKNAADLLSAGQKDFASQWKGAAVIVSYDLEGVLFSFGLLQKKMGFVR